MAAGEAFNAGGGTPVSVRDLVTRACRAAGSDVEPEILGAGTPAGEIDRQYVDTTKIRERTGWEPKVDLDTGLRRTFEWYRHNLDALKAARLT